ncbi:oxalate/formate antiporter family transporter [Thalassovita gelatinovora]|uniref:Oxalate/formate antiporter family transporter n=1 Tax=Thalassovita gelatinovora TaxID=53501 RepID=A0A0N7LVW2_THAGE|nr:MFS transporter [Thalassovita gelatinovora]QIZ81976.1 MFS transporter [Thalassovita gelatinovora]CUH67410.1 oxalate/formate antiporter family transporter [Thalassovita gelatinovora]SEP74620.1 Predicted arabinose efflux permease, MFS family [Thalassovita gelatinovora]
MIPRLISRQRNVIVAALGTSLTVSWASSYYIPAVLAVPMAAEFGLSPVWVFGAFSMAMVVSAIVGPWAGARIDSVGGRGVLMLSILVFASGLGILAVAPSPVILFAGWGVIGLGMGIGLYEAGFATLAGIYGKDARGPITGITLIAGFASTVGWPLSGVMLATWGWREACLGWVLIHLFLALPLNAWLPKGTNSIVKANAPEEIGEQPSRMALALLAFVFAATWFNATAMAAHLPGLLQTAGASTAVAIAAGALIGPAQVAARVLEFSLLRRYHPLVSTRLAAAAHPLAAAALVTFGGPAAFIFAILHGAGNGILTIAKGTLPLALFGAIGYGQRIGWLSAPARILQAAAPLLFGAALSTWGLSAIYLTAGIGMASMAALIILRRT